ncbi:hypothetical protein [Kineococcus aurantiacus]|uniref:Uncharacterized protein n=1 Tax=Kineococcus aurantiacus TaxID=37633 RepID=A0A7Y9J1R1_9ACTN|nr:hypothetical protein [Kineococcus aurantiacus]NYD23390.1 hypothetical protein [Kineococcus aurantiacus]
MNARGREQGGRGEPAPRSPDGQTTSGDVADRARGSVAQGVRRLIVVALLLVVVAGGAGSFGVRTSRASASGGGYELTVTYPRTARAGLDAQWGVDLTAPPEGFGDQVVLAVSSDYFTFWEEQGFSPGPAQETSDGTWDYMTFDPPPGRRFSLSFDGYVQPSSQRGGDGEVAVLTGGRRVVSVAFSTWLAP